MDANASGAESVTAVAAGQWNQNRRSDKISEKLARQIVDDILAQGLEAGSMLPAEAEMMKVYSVGRSTLREALRLLEVQGLLTMKPGPRGGPMLMQLSVGDFARNAKVHLRLRGTTYREILEARLAIEPLMARMAAEAQNPEGLEHLRAAIAAADAIDPSDQHGWQQVSDLFHATIASMSGNSVLDLLGMFLREVYISKPRAPITPTGMRSDVQEVHRAIAEAIFAKDGVAAERLMHDHMKYYAKASDKHHGDSLETPVGWG